jgi:hypothetical protein
MPAVLPERLNAAAQVFGVSAAEVVRRAVPAGTEGDKLLENGALPVSGRKGRLKQ